MGIERDFPQGHGVIGKGGKAQLKLALDIFGMRKPQLLWEIHSRVEFLPQIPSNLSLKPFLLVLLPHSL